MNEQTEARERLAKACHRLVSYRILHTRSSDWLVDQGAKVLLDWLLGDGLPLVLEAAGFVCGCEGELKHVLPWDCASWQCIHRAAAEAERDRLKAALEKIVRITRIPGQIGFDVDSLYGHLDEVADLAEGALREVKSDE